MVQSITRFKKVDSTLYRGAKPDIHQLQALKTAGIDTVIDFSTGYGSSPTERTESQNAQELGINYIHLPFPSFENPSPEYVDTFFETMEQARRENKKVFIHCSHGKDRTGLFAAMYKLAYNLDNLNGCVQEMLSLGHDATANPNLIPYLTCFDETVRLKRINDFLMQKDALEGAKILLNLYPELAWLTGNVNATPEGKVPSSSSKDFTEMFFKVVSTPSTVSGRLFGQTHIEFERTFAGIQCLKFVLNNDYEAFTKCQKESVKLSPQNFEELRNYTLSVLKTPQDVDAMFAYTVINDLGKVQNFKTEVENITQTNAADHDEALLMALQAIPERIPSFNRLNEEYKSNILNGLTASFNLAQFVQGECLPANLSKIKNTTQSAQDMYLVHMFYDVSGAAGHINPNGSLVMSNPVYEGYVQGIKSLQALKNGADEVSVYNDFLTQKGKKLGMTVENAADLALVRLAVMSRAASSKDIADVVQALNCLSKNDKMSLFKGLSADGIKTPGLLLYYSPAFIQNSVNAAPDKKLEMLAKAYQTMSLIYQAVVPQKGVQTISLAPVANAVKQNPNLGAEELYSLLRLPSPTLKNQAFLNRTQKEK